MKLPLIPLDKANHFIYGFMIFFISNLFMNPYISLIIVFTFALGKEIYDERLDWKDIFFTMIPGIILTFKYIINEQKLENNISGLILDYY